MSTYHQRIEAFGRKHDLAVRAAERNADAQLGDALRVMLREAYAAGYDHGSDPTRPGIGRNPYGRKGSYGRRPELLTWDLEQRINDGVDQ